MKDNFDLKKFLVENKAIQNLNPVLGKESLNEGDIRSKIKEMILAELGNNPEYADYDEYEDSYDDESTYYPHTMDLEDDELENSLVDKYDMIDGEEDLYEAKKDEEEEDVEDIEVEDTEEVTPDETPTPTPGGGLEDIAADMEGSEGELMNHLMSALKMAKGMNNEKLETQIGNTLKFFVSEYIGGGE